MAVSKTTAAMVAATAATTALEMKPAGGSLKAGAMANNGGAERRVT